MVNATPTRQTGEVDLDRWNTAMRASPVYQQFMRSIGNDGSGRVKLSRDQQGQLEQALTRAGVPIPDGMHIDQGGNLNQKNRLGRNIGIGAAIGGAALTGFGLAGMGPLGGSLGATAPLAAPAAGSMAVPELSLSALPSVVGPGIAESALPTLSSVTAASAPAVAPAVAPAAAAPFLGSKAATFLAAGAGGAEAIGQNMAASRRQAAQQKFDAEQNQEARALTESQLDPFRDTLAQSDAVQKLDRRQNWKPLVPPPAVAQYMPTGGYTPSPDAQDAAGKMKLSVMAGQTTPSPLDPATNGSRGVSDLTAAPDPLTGRQPFGSPAFSYDPMLAPEGSDSPMLQGLRARLRRRMTPA